MEQAHAISSSSLLRRLVKDRRGQTLGNIQDLVIDLDRGFIAYVVLAFAPWMGQTSKSFIVPWGALRIDPDDRNLVLDVSRQALVSAAGIQSDDLADQDDRTEPVVAACHWADALQGQNA